MPSRTQCPSQTPRSTPQGCVVRWVGMEGQSYSGPTTSRSIRAALDALRLTSRRTNHPREQKRHSTFETAASIPTRILGLGGTVDLNAGTSINLTGTIIDNPNEGAGGSTITVAAPVISLRGSTLNSGWLRLRLRRHDQPDGDKGGESHQRHCPLRRWLGMVAPFRSMAEPCSRVSRARFRREGGGWYRRHDPGGSQQGLADGHATHDLGLRWPTDGRGHYHRGCEERDADEQSDSQHRDGGTGRHHRHHESRPASRWRQRD